jgi:hypothetical protein
LGHREEDGDVADVLTGLAQDLTCFSGDERMIRATKFPAASTVVVGEKVSVGVVDFAFETRSVTNAGRSLHQERSNALNATSRLMMT